MGFMDEYKHLDKICGDMLGDYRKLSAYIDEMIRLTGSAYQIPRWEEDLRRLKRYRWIRNQIVHEPGCTEENLCVQEDVLWLENFYDRILHQEDPLALYHRAIQPKKAYNSRTAVKTPPPALLEKKPEDAQSRKQEATLPVRLIAVLMVLLLLAVAFLLYWNKG